MRIIRNNPSDQIVRAAEKIAKESATRRAKRVENAQYRDHVKKDRNK